MRLLAASNRFTRAGTKFRSLLKQFGAHPALIRTHGLMSLNAGDLDSAERDFSELATGSDDVYESLYYLGQIALVRQDYRQAIRLFSRIRGGAYLLPAQLRIVGAYSKLGEEQTGLDHLSTFTLDYPRHAVDTLEMQAQLLQQMGRSDDALRTYDRIIGFKSATVDLLIARAVLLDAAGRLDEAIDSMEQAVDIAPVNAMALNTLGYTLTNRTNRHAEAYRLIRLALEIAPNSPAIIDSMGWALFRQGHYEQARSYLNSFIEQNPRLF